MLVLRWKYHGERGWKVPPNIRIGKTRDSRWADFGFPGAAVDGHCEPVHQIRGDGERRAFAAVFFIIFTVSERANLRKHALTARQMKDHFQLEHQDTISRESVAIRPGGTMVTMRDAANLFALKWMLARTQTDDQDVL